MKRAALKTAKYLTLWKEGRKEQKGGREKEDKNARVACNP